jgi:crotonobetaine/carnitine-CoA ligase
MSSDTSAPVTYATDPGQSLSLPELLARRVEQSGESAFVIFAGERITFAEFSARAVRAAAALASEGVGPGDKVALMLRNSVSFLELWFGAARLGAVLVPVNTGLRAGALAYILGHSDARIVVAEDDLTERIDAVLDGSGDRLRRLVRGGERPGWVALDEWLAGNHGPVSPPAVRGSDLASILYTSGTTGLPKGVMNVHNAYVVAGHEFVANYVRIRGDDILYTSLPLFHVNAQMLTITGALVAGRPAVLAPRFSASGFFDEIRRSGATVFNYIGAMLTMIYKQPPADEDGQNPARLAVGGAASAEIWTAFERRFALRILEIYGLTETATFCLGSPPDDIRVGQVGLPVSWAEVRAAREDGSVAAEGQPGELLIRSKQRDVLFRGYYKNEIATREAMRGEWFRSGDRGVFEDGSFRFVDRIKDIIRRRGENISSLEIEQIVNMLPEVAESAAVGVPSELGEDEVMIVVVLKPGKALEPSALIEFCREQMAEFMVPRYVLVRDALPKTATERVQKYLLREGGVDGAWDREAGEMA